ncbi:MAG: sulfotransferase [Proteobacteria bacterium]|nr:sulfotransferase [Pseudomonadota bacterium]
MDRNELIADLPASIREVMLQSDLALRRGDRVGALAIARRAAQAAPGHPEVLRVLAAALSAHGPSAEAIDMIEQALAFYPDDPVALTTHALVMQANGRIDQAVESFRLASELVPESANNAYNLGRALFHHGEESESLGALERALALDPEHRNARATAAEVLVRLGRSDEAATHLRHLLERNPADVRTWAALATHRAAAIDAGDLAAMTALFDNPATGADDRVRLGFALGKLRAGRAEHAQAFSAYVRANALVRERVPWNAAGHARAVGELLGAFVAPAKADSNLGSDMIFVVSLPRSGSTLAEQILAAHPRVDAGDERNDVFNVIEDENRRRKQPLSQWAKIATTDDWQRLGADYLQRSRRWRAGGTQATDKLPSNWLWLGAIAAMLPGARVLDCRRDRLETAWSCFCHLFRIGTQDFSYDFASIAAFARDYDHAMAHWSALYPTRIRTQSYEALVADPEAQTRQLLDFCGLEFDPACLRFWEAQRSVRETSASQVREPIRRDTARTDAYGALLDPLRKELGLRAYAAT